MNWPREQQSKILQQQQIWPKTTECTLARGSKNGSQQRDEDEAGEQMKKLIDASAQRQQPRISCGSKQPRVGQPQELLINDVDF
jgi:hypothetical protein